MIDLIIEIYPLICIVLPCVIYQLISVRKLESKVYLFRHMVWTYIFLFYVFLVIQITGGGTVWDIGRYGDIIRFDEIRLIPFEQGISIESILNIIMFMPLGFLLPLIWRKCRSVLKISVIGMSCSFAIEVGQLFNRRFTDINDLIMNTLGAVLGYVIWIIFKKLFKNAGEKSAELSENEPIAYLLLSFFGTFLLYNWRWLVEFIDYISKL